MHTTIRAIRSRRVLLAGWALLLASLLFGSVAPAVAQPSFPGAPDERGANARVYPADLWSPRVGFGIGGGLVLHNLVRQHDQWLFSAAPAQHEQLATAAFASADPQPAHRYVLLTLRALHTDRDWLGPPAQRTVLERSALRARVRVGQTVFDRLLVQPHLTVMHHQVDDTSLPSAEPTVAAPLPTAGSEQTGARVGVDLRYDTRDQSSVTTRGVLLQGTWDRYIPLTERDLHFDQVDLDAYRYVPLGGVHRIATRLSLTLTENRGNETVPVYMLPTVGGSVVPGWARSRFVASERLLASALYRFPLLQYEDLLTIEGHVGIHMTSTYETIGDQFSLTVSFDDPVVPDGSARPLRPSASAGLRFAMPRREHVDIELAAGLSPEGVSAVRFSLVRSLRSIRSPHHSSNNLR